MNIKNIIRHIRNFEKSGRISNSLVPFFDQNGKWWGEELIPPLPDKGPRARYEIPHSLMRRIKLPKERRITGDMKRPVLRTSFITRNDKVVNIPYSAIRGSVLSRGRASVFAESLQFVGGDFSTNTKHTVHIPNLHTVGGDFRVIHSFKLTATSLHEIGGNLYLIGRLPPNLVLIRGFCIMQQAKCIRDNALRYVGKSICLNDLEKVHFPELESVGQDLVIAKANRIEARKLRKVGGLLQAGTAEIMLMPSLRYVGGDLNSQSAQEFFHPLLEVRGRWMQAPGAREFWVRRMRALSVLRGNQGPMYL
jgi:hypothetical protein